MNFQIREIREEEYGVLEEFLYEAIYVPEGMQRPSREILQTPELQVYLENFGREKDDYGFAALAEGEIVGAVWARIMNDYGHVDENTPSLALAVYREYRGQGIGTALLQAILNRLQEKGYGSVSLSVQKSNPAFRLYRRLGFQVAERAAEEIGEERIMIKNLQEKLR